MNANWVNELYIGTEYTPGSGGAAGTWTYAKLCKGIEGMEFNENEQNQQFFFLCGEGFAHNEVTGAAPELTITGRRIVGDTAQDYIASKQFLLGTDRNSSVKIVAEGKQIVCDCSVGAITSFGGQTLDVNAFGCTIRFNGKPVVTDVT
jgi:hypothetical protein